MDVTLVVDALSPQLSGIGRYTWELCNELPRQRAIDRLFFFRNGGLVPDPAELLEPKQRDHADLFPPRPIRNWLARRKLRSSIVHGPNYFLPRQVESGIITIHDLSVFRYPETHPAERLRVFGREFESSLRRARHIITDTETVRSELVADFGISEERITAVPLGVSGDYRPRKDAELNSCLAQLGLQPQNYALCVSTLEPRKRINELLQAWRKLPQRLRSSYPLVIVGSVGWLSGGLQDDIGRATREGWVKFLGYVPESVLPLLYSGTALFVYPSIYEGFGLPALEALASGAPTLVADRSCFPEVCGEAAMYIEPDDVDAFSKAISRALDDDAWKEIARARGLERAAKFTWARCAQLTAEVYRAHAH